MGKKKKKKKKSKVSKAIKNVNVPRNTFKLEKTKDHLIVWRKTPQDDDWRKWQNIPAKDVENFESMKIK